MNLHLLNTEIQEYINANLETDATTILLKKFKFEHVSLAEIAEQLKAKQRCKKKLPTWYGTPNIYYPNKLNMEQTSSEQTADYKSEIIAGQTLLDLTGGFGVDSFYFSKQFEQVTHCEINEDLSAIVAHNSKQLCVENIKVHFGDGVTYLEATDQQFDWIYIDPSRRHDSKGKVFFLSDCLPNVPEQLDLIFDHTNHILIKVSPMLDISQAISELKYVTTIHVVAINNEVKELLFILKKNDASELLVQTINKTKTGEQRFSFVFDEERSGTSPYSEVQNYVYEPNAAILKSGAFQMVATKFKLNKLHKHSHLYTSSELIDFPGRIFKVDKVFPYQKRMLKKEINHLKCNVATRNFPETVAQLKNRFHLKDGGDLYLFFTTNCHNEKVVIVSEKA